MPFFTLQSEVLEGVHLMVELICRYSTSVRQKVFGVNLVARSN